MVHRRFDLRRSDGGRGHARPQECAEIIEVVDRILRGPQHAQGQRPLAPPSPAARPGGGGGQLGWRRGRAEALATQPCVDPSSSQSSAITGSLRRPPTAPCTSAASGPKNSANFSTSTAAMSWQMALGRTARSHAFKLISSASPALPLPSSARSRSASSSKEAPAIASTAPPRLPPGKVLLNMPL